VEEIAGWLPAAIFETGIADEKRKFVRKIADELLGTLVRLRGERLGATPTPSEVGDAADNEQAADPDDGTGGGLIDLCFEHGLLPSYAFPTDLCSFVIQDWDKTRSRWRVTVKERPQLAKAQALSAWAAFGGEQADLSSWGDLR
jgi:hypothetical protein